MTSFNKALSLLVLILFALVGLAGCASHDRQDTHLLGGALDHNIAVQSVRDVDERDERSVEGTVR